MIYCYNIAELILIGNQIHIIKLFFRINCSILSNTKDSMCSD